MTSVNKEMKEKGRLRGAFKDSWSPECDGAFKVLKNALCSAPVLGYAQYQRPFIVETDASHLGLGAVLSQEQEGPSCRHRVRESQGCDHPNASIAR